MGHRQGEPNVGGYAPSTMPSNTPRTRAEIERFFSGLVMVPPYRGAAPRLTSAGLWDCEDPETAESDGSRSFYVGVARKPPSAAPPVAKLTVEELRIDVGELVWRRSAEGSGAIEVAFARTGSEKWVLMRLIDDPDRRVSVFSRFEWDCFLDGVRNGEFDGTAS